MELNNTSCDGTASDPLEFSIDTAGNAADDPALLVENKFRLEGNVATASTGVATFDQLKILRQAVNFNRNLIDCDDANMVALNGDTGGVFCPPVAFDEKLSFKVDCNFDNKEDLPIPTLQHNNTEYDVRIQKLRTVVAERTTTSDIARPMTDPGFRLVVQKCLWPAPAGAAHAPNGQPCLCGLNAW